jgi:hypothetical protein
MTRKLKNSLIKQKQQNKQEVPQITGILGLPLDGSRRVEVSNRNSYVYVRLRNNESEVIQAFNNQVSPAYNLPVIVERHGNRYVVMSVDTQRYENNWNSFAPFLPRHGNTHAFNIETGGGGDVVWIYSPQFVPLLAQPSGSAGGPNVFINAYTLKNSDGTWKYIGNTGTADLTPYIPSSPTGAVMVLVYVDTMSGNPGFLVGSGTVFLNSITGANQITPYIPAVTNNDWIPDVAIRLVTGTSIISWNNMYDVRQWLHATPSGTGGSGLSSVAVQDEGITKGNVATFNFVGNNVDVSVSGTVARVFVTGSSGGSSLIVDDTDGASVSNVTRITLTGTATPFVVDDGGGHALVFVQNRGIDVLDVGGSLDVGVTRLEFADTDFSASGTTVRITPTPEDGPQGFGYNYKISPTTVSGSLVVSIKTLAGTDPSPEDKLVFRIGNTRREVSSAKSFSIATGTNWFNAASTELVGQNIDFFIYAVYDTNTSSVQFGMARVPYGTREADFVNTTTDELYIKGNFTYNSNDEVENIGRINALLSAGKAWSVSSTAINRPIFVTDYQTYQPVYSGFGSMTYTSVTTNFARYCLKWKTVIVEIDAFGTTGGSASNGIQATVPFKSRNAPTDAVAFTGWVFETTTIGAAVLLYNSGGTHLLKFNRYDGANFGLGANRYMSGSGQYELQT